MVNYGSNIKFAEAKNNWIASANIEHHDTIFIRKNKVWEKNSLYQVIKQAIAIIPHETMHNILWGEGLDYGRNYDRIRNKIIRNKKISQRMREFYYRCM